MTFEQLLELLQKVVLALLAIAIVWGIFSEVSKIVRRSVPQMAKGMNYEEWLGSINSLLSHYCDIERRSLALPMISVTPYLRVLWDSIKFYCFLVADILLLVPLNLIILLNNVVRPTSKWAYRSFVARYLKDISLWLWRGEVIYIPTVVIRPLVSSFLAFHFTNRLLLLRRIIMVESRLSEENRRKLLLPINMHLKLWKGRGLFLNALNYVSVSTAVAAVGLYNELCKPNCPTTLLHVLANLPGWQLFLIGSFLAYLILALFSAFMTKRGLMLGGSGISSAFPGAYGQSGVYAEERNILASIGIVRRELPLDLFFTTLVYGLTPFNFVYHVLLYPRSSTDTNLSSFLSPMEFAVLVVYSMLTLLSFILIFQRFRMRRA